MNVAPRGTIKIFSKNVPVWLIIFFLAISFYFFGGKGFLLALSFFGLGIFLCYGGDSTGNTSRGDGRGTVSN